MEKHIDRRQAIADLMRSSHGKLEEYVPVGRQFAANDPEFFAHLIAYNHEKGTIRDSKVALPIISLALGDTGSPEFKENTLAHIASLDPRNLVKALDFHHEIKKGSYSRSRQLRGLVASYLRAREDNWGWWERAAVQHRASMKTLYARNHIKPSTRADLILFKGEVPKGTIFEAVKNLSVMSAQEAAGTIMERGIPFLVAIGALGAKAKEPDLVLALINKMSPTELVTNTKMLERLGVKTNPALRSAFEGGLQRAATSKAATFKTTRAAESMTDTGLREKLRGTQEKQIKELAGIDGNWLVLGDKSGSMTQAIELSKLVASTLAKMVKGRIHLVFFDTQPRYIDATGKDYDALLAETKHVSAAGGTSIGCGLAYALERELDVDGIAIISDSAENNVPFFAPVYQKYAQKFEKEPPVYLYKTVGESTEALERNCEAAKIELQRFDLRGGKIDYYALPNIIGSMRANRYGLIDEIMATPLLKLESVLKGKVREAEDASAVV